MRKLIIYIIPAAIAVLIVIYFISPFSNNGINFFISGITGTDVTQNKDIYQSVDATGSESRSGFTNIVDNILNREKKVPIQTELSEEEDRQFRTNPSASTCLMKAYNDHINNWYEECKKEKKPGIECELPESIANLLNSNYQEQKNNCIK